LQVKNTNNGSQENTNFILFRSFEKFNFSVKSGGNIKQKLPPGKLSITTKIIGL